MFLFQTIPLFPFQNFYCSICHLNTDKYLQGYTDKYLMGYRDIHHAISYLMIENTWDKVNRDTLLKENSVNIAYNSGFV